MSLPTPDPRTFAAQVGELVEEVVAFALKFGEAASSQPIEGSPADGEINHNIESGPGGLWGREPVERSFNVAAYLYGGAGQYLRALRQLLQDDIALFGFQAVTRALLEAAARSWWILDPDSSVRQRVERAYDELFYSYNEMWKFANAIGGEDAQQVREETQLWVDAANLGLKPRTERNAPLGRQVGVGPPRLTSTEIVPAMLLSFGIDEGEKWYRTFSGVIHSALYTQVGNWEAVQKEGSATYHLEPQLSLTEIAQAAILSVSSYLGTIERHASLYGRDWEQLRSERQSVVIRIKAHHDMFVEPRP